MAYKFNPFTGKLDIVNAPSQVSKESGTITEGWFRIAQATTLPASGIFYIKYKELTEEHILTVMVTMKDGATAPVMTILNNTKKL